MGTQNQGYCTWRESLEKTAQPHMNIGSTFVVSKDGTILRTRWDSSCQQWQPTVKK